MSQATNPVNSIQKGVHSRVFVEELLGFVDFGCQIGTSATVGVVEQHELTVLFAHLVLVQSPFTVPIS